MHFPWEIANVFEKLQIPILLGNLQEIYIRIKCSKCCSIGAFHPPQTHTCSQMVLALFFSAPLFMPSSSSSCSVSFHIICPRFGAIISREHSVSPEILFKTHHKRHHGKWIFWIFFSLPVNTKKKTLLFGLFSTEVSRTLIQENFHRKITKFLLKDFSSQDSDIILAPISHKNLC